jgi:hypothetical protein
MIPPLDKDHMDQLIVTCLDGRVLCDDDPVPAGHVAIATTAAIPPSVLDGIQHQVFTAGALAPQHDDEEETAPSTDDDTQLQADADDAFAHSASVHADESDSVMPSDGDGESRAADDQDAGSHAHDADNNVEGRADDDVDADADAGADAHADADVDADADAAVEVAATDPPAGFSVADFETGMTGITTNIVHNLTPRLMAKLWFLRAGYYGPKSEWYVKDRRKKGRFPWAWSTDVCPGECHTHTHTHQTHTRNTHIHAVSHTNTTSASLFSCCYSVTPTLLAEPLICSKTLRPLVTVTFVMHTQTWSGLQYMYDTPACTVERYLHTECQNIHPMKVRVRAIRSMDCVIMTHVAAM